jgi:hypothetical protein
MEIASFLSFKRGQQYYVDRRRKVIDFVIGFFLFYGFIILLSYILVSVNSYWADDFASRAISWLGGIRWAVFPPLEVLGLIVRVGLLPFTVSNGLSGVGFGEVIYAIILPLLLIFFATFLPGLYGRKWLSFGALWMLGVSTLLTLIVAVIGLILQGGPNNILM